MLPLHDDNPTTRRPVVTVVLILACLAVYFLVQGGVKSALGEGATDQPEFTVKNAAIPCEIVQGHPLTDNELRRTFALNDPDACDKNDTSPQAFPDKQIYVALLVSMFLHAGLLHLGGNMLFLWVFGNNIEDHLSAFGFLAFYLAGGIVATLGHVALDPDSTVPVVGASGAIAAVMGAYLVLYPRARINSIIILGFFVLFRKIPAWVLLGVWFLSQFLIDPTSGVAWAAHVAGFVFGVIVGLVLRATGGRPTKRAPIYA